MKNPIGFETDCPKTIYTDIVNMPDPIRLGITIRYYNHSDQTLYLKFSGIGSSAWTPNSTELGAVGSGVSKHKNFNNFMVRPLPTAELEDWITFTLRGYSDAEYNNLVYEFSRASVIIFLKSDDGSWTLDENDDFDDLVECADCAPQDGWNIIWEYEGHPADRQHINVVTDYVLSSSYALQGLYIAYWNGSERERRWRIYKEFTTLNKDEVFAIINVRFDAVRPPTGGTYNTSTKYLRITWGATELIYIGRPKDAVQEDYFPRKKWMRFVIPLPKNETDELRIIIDVICGTDGGGVNGKLWTWIDDVKIISR